MQKTNNACSILLPCTWEDMGTHVALAGKLGVKQDDNHILGKVVVRGAENIILANTDQHIVVASDHLTVVVTGNTVFVGDRDTDMKDLLEHVAQKSPEIV
jgi:mannose-1-phosphate guanylyltransferase